MSYIPKDAVTQAFRSNKGVLTPNQIIELDNENKFTKYGQLELIQTQTASSISTLDFTSIEEDTYNVHFLTVNNYQADTDNKIFTIQLFENGVVETASVYQTSFSSGVMSVGSGIDNASDSSANSYIYFYNLGDSTKYSFSTFHTIYNYYDGAVLEMNFGSGVLAQASVVDGMRILTNGGTFSGNFSLYGIRSF
jgi:hypothetical protein